MVGPAPPLLITLESRRVSLGRSKEWRRRSESNRWIKVLQTSALPLGYAALIIKTKLILKQKAKAFLSRDA